VGVPFIPFNDDDNNPFGIAQLTSHFEFIARVSLCGVCDQQSSDSMSLSIVQIIPQNDFFGLAQLIITSPLIARVPVCAAENQQHSKFGRSVS
jgi:hypothetical protein